MICDCNTNFDTICPHPDHSLAYPDYKTMEYSLKWGVGSWYNTVYREEEAIRSRMTPQQIIEETEKIRKRDKIHEDNIKGYMMKKKEYYMDKSGMAKKKFNKPCKHEQQHGMLCDKANSGEPTDKCSIEDNCGCWPQRINKGSCSFIHEEEKEYMIALFKEFGIPEGRCLIIDKIIDGKVFYKKN